MTIGIAFRLMPVGPVVAQERDGEMIFLAHDEVWNAVLKKVPEFPVRYLARMIGNPRYAAEYSSLACTAFEMAEFASEHAPDRPIHFDRLIASMEKAAEQRASGQSSLFG